MPRPENNEYAEFYANYVALVEETEIVPALSAQIDDLRALFDGISDAQGDFAYSAGKWTIKELLGHLIDAERVFSYRALRISRGDQTPLAGFDENEYVDSANFNGRTLADMLEEFSLLRASNAIFFENLDDSVWFYTGTASDALVSVRALAFIMVGHVRHHINILKSRYLNK